MNKLLTVYTFKSSDKLCIMDCVNYKIETARVNVVHRIGKRKQIVDIPPFIRLYR